MREWKVHWSKRSSEFHVDGKFELWNQLSRFIFHKSKRFIEKSGQGEVLIRRVTQKLWSCTIYMLYFFIKNCHFLSIDSRSVFFMTLRVNNLRSNQQKTLPPRQSELKLPANTFKQLHSQLTVKTFNSFIFFSIYHRTRCFLFRETGKVMPS